MKKSLVALVFFMTSCHSNEVPTAIHFPKNTVPLYNTFAGTWGAYSAGIEISSKQVAELYLQFKINLLTNTEAAQNSSINYVAMYLNDVSPQKFQNDWGNILTQDLSTGEYRIRQGQEEAFKAKSKDWAIDSTAAFSYPDSSTANMDTPLREAYQKAAKLRTVVNLQNSIQNKVNNSEEVQTAYRSFQEVQNRFLDKVSSYSVLVQEATNAGFNGKDLVDLQRIADKAGTLLSVRTSARDFLGAAGQVIKGSWNTLFSYNHEGRFFRTPEEKEQLTKSMMNDLAAETGVDNEKALRYYVEHKLENNSASRLINEMDGIATATGVLQAVGVTQAYDKWQGTAGNTYKKMGLIPQSEWSAFQFAKDDDRKNAMRQIMSNINSTYPNNELETVTADGDWKEFKEVKPDNILSFSYNPILSSQGQGTWRFGYIDPKDKSAMKYITVQMPFSQIGNAIPYKGQNIPILDREIVRCIYFYNNNYKNNQLIEAVPFFYGKSRNGIFVRFAYSIVYDNGSYLAEIQMNVHGQCYTITLSDDETEEVIQSNNPEDLVVAIYKKEMDVNYWETLFEQTSALRDVPQGIPKF